MNASSGGRRDYLKKVATGVIGGTVGAAGSKKADAATDAKNETTVIPEKRPSGFEEQAQLFKQPNGYSSNPIQ